MKGFFQTRAGSALSGLALLATTLIGCQNSPTLVEPFAVPTNDSEGTLGIGISGYGDTRAVEDISSAVAEAAPQICADLQVACDFQVSIQVYPDQEAFDRFVSNPDMRGYYAISGDGRIEMVSPDNPGREGMTYEDGVGVAVHEFVHLALDEINPELPSWLDEGTAVALGPHELYTAACRERLPGVPLPDLVDLVDHYAEVPAADLFAYTLVGSIIETDGLDGLNRLLRATDPDATVMEAQMARQTTWAAFVEGGCEEDPEP